MTEELSLLAEFNDGFTAGYRGEPKEKGRTPTYNNAYTKGAEAKRREQ